MSGKLENKVAVVTGGSTGIGFATAKRFVTEGAFVFMTGRRASELNRAAEMLGPNAVAVLADSSDLADLDRLYELINREAGRIDILFANAGGGSKLPLGSITEERAVRRYVRPECEGCAVHHAEGASAARRRRLCHPYRLDRQHRRDACLQRLRRIQGRRAQLRPSLDARSQEAPDTGQCVEPRPNKDAGSARPRR